MLSKLFKSWFSAASAAEAIPYKDYLIYPEPRAEGGQYRLAGRVCKEIDGELKTHVFIRSDLCPSQEEAEQLMVRKAQLFIDQTGDAMFR